MIARFLGVVPLAVLVVVLGCGETTPTFDPAVAYTPESLASELSFRYNSLPPTARDIAGTAKPKARGPVEQRKNEATKEEKGENLGTVLDDIIAKSESITATTPAVARNAVADQIEKDATIAADHKKKIIGALRQAP